jgi:AcrR family transcriptional regulator
MSTPDTEPKKSELRRQKLVQAAIRCFEERGFHGASMSQISEEAGMSVGHIYHYFPGKEALIAAIAEVKLGEAIQRMNVAASKASLIHALVARAGDCEVDHLKPGERALFFEIVAESERNPKIAELLRMTDERALQRQREIFRELAPQAAELSDDDLNARLEVFNALLDGMTVRALCNPGYDTEKMEFIVERVLQALISS